MRSIILYVLGIPVSIIVLIAAFYAPDAASVPNPKPWFHRASGTWYQVVGRDGGWYQRWWQIG